MISRISNNFISEALGISIHLPDPIKLLLIYHAMITNGIIATDHDKRWGQIFNIALFVKKKWIQK